MSAPLNEMGTASRTPVNERRWKESRLRRRLIDSTLRWRLDEDDYDEEEDDDDRNLRAA